MSRDGDGGLDPSRRSASPVHLPGHTLRWTTANVDEGLPGVLSPLTWSMYFPPTESTMRQCWVDMGVMSADQGAIPTDVDERFFSTAYGRAIANVDGMAQLAARIPGGSAAALEEQLFGAVTEGGLGEPRGLEKVGRWPQVAVKLPRVLRRSMRRHPSLSAEVSTWWDDRVFGPEPDRAEAVRELVAARERFEEVLTVHMVLSMATQGIMEQVAKLAERAGRPSLAGEVIKAEGGTAEFELVRDIWAMVGGSLDIDGFLRRHGYHGPREGLVESVVWRENPGAAHDIVEAYRQAEHGDMDQLVARRAGEQRVALAELKAGLGPAHRAIAGPLVTFAARVPEWRETGRMNILKCVDVARTMSRTIGRHLADDATLDEPSDVKFLSIDELAELDGGSVDLDGGSVDLDELRERIALRRADHALFERFELPHLFHGDPEPIRVATSSDAADEPANPTAGRQVTGLGVSSGVAEGVVRVLTDLDASALFDDVDDVVMVCRATDPSWASLFPLSVAVVTDTGSQMSHAAIVCRELGLPCVANTHVATTELVDGMRVRVDGADGTVTIL